MSLILVPVLCSYLRQQDCVRYNFEESPDRYAVNEVSALVIVRPNIFDKLKYEFLQPGSLALLLLHIELLRKTQSFIFCGSVSGYLATFSVYRGIVKLVNTRRTFG